MYFDAIYGMHDVNYTAAVLTFIQVPSHSFLTVTANNSSNKAAINIVYLIWVDVARLWM